MENKTFDALLQPVRQDIDRIDRQLLQLFTERMACSERVAEIKRQAGIPVLNTAREQAILDRVRQEAGARTERAPVALYSTILSVSRARQHAMLEGGGELRALERNSPRSRKENPRIICQGAPGAYSHSAANRLFPRRGAGVSARLPRRLRGGARRRGATTVSCPSKTRMRAAFPRCTTSSCGTACSSSARRTSRCGTACAAPPGTGPVRRAVSKAGGARAVQRRTSKKTASPRRRSRIPPPPQKHVRGAPGGRARRGLLGGGRRVLRAGGGRRRHPEHRQTTAPRFVVIAREAVLPGDADKISLCFSLPHTTGSLYRTLERFALNGLNLTKIESRPIPGRNFEYDFYLDFTGNIHDEATLALICALSDEMPRFSFLGNYKEG